MRIQPSTHKLMSPRLQWISKEWQFPSHNYSHNKCNIWYSVIFLKFQSSQHLQTCHSPDMWLLHMSPANKGRFQSSRIDARILHSQHLENFQMLHPDHFYTCTGSQMLFSKHLKIHFVDLCTKRLETRIWFGKSLSKGTSNKSQVWLR